MKRSGWIALALVALIARNGNDAPLLATLAAVNMAVVPEIPRVPVFSTAKTAPLPLAQL